MNLQHLRYFITLADLEHYTKASEQLHITQPTLSHAITLLENELGVRLFSKSGRNVELSKAGKIFSQRIKIALRMIDDSVLELQAYSQESAVINIALLRVLSHHIVPNLIREFIDHHPNQTANFVFHNDSGMSCDMLDGLVTKKYDLTFCSMCDDYPQVSFLPIVQEDLVLITPLHHELTQKPIVTLADTLAYPQIWFSHRSGMRPILDRLFKDYHYQVNIAFEVEEDETIAGLVAENFGIAIVPKLDILKTMAVDIIELEELKNQRFYYMAYLTNGFHHPTLQSFIDDVSQTTPKV